MISNDDGVNVNFVRSADLGILGLAARCHQGPVWEAALRQSRTWPMTAEARKRRAALPSQSCDAAPHVCSEPKVTAWDLRKFAMGRWARPSVPVRVDIRMTVYAAAPRHQTGPWRRHAAFFMALRRAVAVRRRPHWLLGKDKQRRILLIAGASAMSPTVSFSAGDGFQQVSKPDVARVAPVVWVPRDLGWEAAQIQGDRHDP